MLCKMILNSDTDVLRKVHLGNPAKVGEVLGSLLTSIIWDLILSYQITEAAKNRVSADRLLQSYRGCLLDQNMFKDGADDGKTQQLDSETISVNCHPCMCGVFHLFRLVFSRNSHVILTVKQSVNQTSDCSFKAAIFLYFYIS